MKIKTECAYDKMVPIGKVKPNPKNPNRHPDRQIEMLAVLIKHFGWRGPITISNFSGLVVRGHGRLMAARKLKLRSVPVDFQDYENEIEELADLLADNKISELSYLDDEKVKALFQHIDSDLEFTAFDLDEIDRLMKDHTGFLADTDLDGEDDQPGDDQTGGDESVK